MSLWIQCMLKILSASTTVSSLSRGEKGDGAVWLQMLSVEVMMQVLACQQLEQWGMEWRVDVAYLSALVSLWINIWKRKDPRKATSVSHVWECFWTYCRINNFDPFYWVTKVTKPRSFQHYSSQDTNAGARYNSIQQCYKIKPRRTCWSYTYASVKATEIPKSCTAVCETMHTTVIYNCGQHSGQRFILWSPLSQSKQNILHPLTLSPAVQWRKALFNCFGLMTLFLSSVKAAPAQLLCSHYS